eukprot:UN20836
MFPPGATNCSHGYEWTALPKHSCWGSFENAGDMTADDVYGHVLKILIVLPLNMKMALDVNWSKMINAIVHHILRVMMFTLKEMFVRVGLLLVLAENVCQVLVN